MFSYQTRHFAQNLLKTQVFSHYYYKFSYNYIDYVINMTVLNSFKIAL